MRCWLLLLSFVIHTPCWAFGWAFGEQARMELGMIYRVAIDPDLPRRYVCVHARPEPHEMIEGHQRITEILLLAPDRHHVLQRIPMTGEFSLDARDVEYGDFNWDGYRDFRIYDRISSGKGCRMHYNYLFQPKTGRYEPCAALDELCSVRFDDDDKTIQTWSKSGGSDYATSTYAWRGGRLRLVSKVVHSYDEKTKLYYAEYTDRRKDGSLRVRRFYRDD